MSTQTISDRREHIRSIGVTALSSLAGVGAAFASAAMTVDQSPADAAGDPLAILVVFAVVFIQFPLYKQSGIYAEDEFGIKHYLFVTFMTFSFWFITWGIMLTTGFEL